MEIVLGLRGDPFTILKVSLNPMNRSYKADAEIVLRSRSRGRGTTRSTRMFSSASGDTAISKLLNTWSVDSVGC